MFLLNETNMDALNTYLYLSRPVSRVETCVQFKWNMHHKYDMMWKDAFYNAHIAAFFIFEIPAYRRRGHSLTAWNAAPPATPNRPIYTKWLTVSKKRSNLRLIDTAINFR